MGWRRPHFTPWVLERSSPLKVFGPKGLQRVTDHLLQAYAVDIDFRLHGFERANEVGYQVQVQVQEIQEGIIYRDERVQVEAFAVSHGTLESYGYRFVTQDGVIVVSGDTTPLPVVAEKPRAATFCCTRVEYAAGIRCREEKMAEVPPRGPPSAPTLPPLLHRRSPSCWSPPIASTT